MAFVLNMQSTLSAPTAGNIAGVRNTIQSGLRNVTAKVKLSGSSQTIRDITRLQHEMRRFDRIANQGSETIEEFSRRVSIAGKRFIAFSIASLTLIKFITGFKNAVSGAVEFEREIVKVGQVTTRSLSLMREFRGEVLGTAKAFGVNSLELAKASVIIAQTGAGLKQVKETLTAIAAASLGPTFGSMEQIAEALIAVQNQFKNAGTSVEILTKLNTVAAKFPVEAQDLITTVQKAGGSFASLGGNLEELLALFTSVRSTTRESADTIATGFRTIFGRLARPETVKFFREQFGIGLTDLEGNLLKPLEQIRALNQGLGKLGANTIRFQEAIEEIGGIRQRSKVIPLIQQFAKTEEVLKKIKEPLSILDDAATAQDALSIKFEKSRQSFQEFADELVQDRSFRTMIDYVLKLANGFAEVSKSLITLIPLATAAFAIFAGQGITRAITANRGAGSLFRLPVTGFASGGKINGPNGRDVIPAMLTAGEVVLNEKQQDRIQKLTGINSQNLFNAAGVPGFANGGIVGKSILAYEAMDRDGNEVKGRLEVSSPEELMSTLRKKGLFVTDITDPGKLSGGFSGFLFNKSKSVSVSQPPDTAAPGNQIPRAKSSSIGGSIPNVALSHIPRSDQRVRSTEEAKSIAKEFAKSLGFSLDEISTEFRQFSKGEIAKYKDAGQNVHALFGTDSTRRSILFDPKKATTDDIREEVLHAIDFKLGGGRFASQIKGTPQNVVATSFKQQRTEELLDQAKALGTEPNEKFIKNRTKETELFAELLRRQTPETQRKLTSGKSPIPDTSQTLGVKNKRDKLQDFLQEGVGQPTSIPGVSNTFGFGVGAFGRGNVNGPTVPPNKPPGPPGPPVPPDEPFGPFIPKKVRENRQQANEFLNSERPKNSRFNLGNSAAQNPLLLAGAGFALGSGIQASKAFGDSSDVVGKAIVSLTSNMAILGATLNNSNKLLGLRKDLETDLLKRGDALNKVLDTRGKLQSVRAATSGAAKNISSLEIERKDLQDRRSAIRTSFTTRDLSKEKTQIAVADVNLKKVQREISKESTGSGANNTKLQALIQQKLALEQQRDAAKEIIRTEKKSTATQESAAKKEQAAIDRKINSLNQRIDKDRTIVAENQKLTTELKKQNENHTRASKSISTQIRNRRSQIAAEEKFNRRATAGLAVAGVVGGGLSSLGQKRLSKGQSGGTGLSAAGGALEGGVTGATLGFALGGPVGAAVGGTVFALGGFITALNSAEESVREFGREQSIQFKEASAQGRKLSREEFQSGGKALSGIQDFRKDTFDLNIPVGNIDPEFIKTRKFDPKSEKDQSDLKTIANVRTGLESQVAQFSNFTSFLDKNMGLIGQLSAKSGISIENFVTLFRARFDVAQELEKIQAAITQSENEFDRFFNELDKFLNFIDDRVVKSKISGKSIDFLASGQFSQRESTGVFGRVNNISDINQFRGIAENVASPFGVGKNLVDSVTNSAQTGQKLRGFAASIPRGSAIEKDDIERLLQQSLRGDSTISAEQAKVQFANFLNKTPGTTLDTRNINNESLVQELNQDNERIAQVFQKLEQTLSDEENKLSNALGSYREANERATDIFVQRIASGADFQRTLAGLRKQDVDPNVFRNRDSGILGQLGASRSPLAIGQEIRRLNNRGTDLDKQTLTGNLNAQQLEGIALEKSGIVERINQLQKALSFLGDASERSAAAIETITQAERDRLAVKDLETRILLGDKDAERTKKDLDSLKSGELDVTEISRGKLKTLTEELSRIGDATFATDASGNKISGNQARDNVLARRFSSEKDKEFLSQTSATPSREEILKERQRQKNEQRQSLKQLNSGLQREIGFKEALDKGLIPKIDTDKDIANKLNPGGLSRQQLQSGEKIFTTDPVRGNTIEDKGIDPRTLSRQQIRTEKRKAGPSESRLTDKEFIAKRAQEFDAQIQRSRNATSGIFDAQAAGIFTSSPAEQSGINEAVRAGQTAQAAQEVQGGLEQDRSKEILDLARQQFLDVFKDLNIQSAIINAQQLNLEGVNFGAVIEVSEKLQKAMESIPESINFEGSLNVNVNFNGAQSLEKLQPEIKEIATNAAKEEMNKMIKAKMPSAGRI